uniref:Uncharacterized protein n=1 Tax=Pyxicephalus adspersus TaxID=30357 RepID=A0AAV3AS31_PYXAD|nr:TPA: hypothetical protein GDO54_009696 [Pyxicephalus adspersus]
MLKIIFPSSERTSDNNPRDQTKETLFVFKNILPNAANSLRVGRRDHEYNNIQTIRLAKKMPPRPFSQLLLFRSFTITSTNPSSQ